MGLRPKLKIALLGQGRMGTLVKALAKERGFQISEASYAKDLILTGCDICIDFSHASEVPVVVKKCIEESVSLVIGSTGWEEHFEAVKSQMEESRIGCVYSANYSVGIFLLEHALSSLARLLDKMPKPAYETAISEMHHSKKVDAPSGTALQLANYLKIPLKNIVSTRCGTLPGTHTVLMDSSDDTLELTHRAKNRSCFAEGALFAAELIKDKQGFYTFKELLREAYAL